MSKIILLIREGIDAVLKFDSGASNISAGSGWSQKGDSYTQQGNGPTLTIVISIGAGNLTLTH